MAKKKKRKGLLIGCLVLTLLAVLYAGILVVSKQQEEQETAEEALDAVTLLSLDKSDIVKISYTREDGTYTFAYEENKWISEAEPEESIRGSYLGNICNVFSNTTAERVVEETTTNLESYGLDTPAYTVTATVSSGEETTLYIGDFNSAVSQYYAYTDKTEGVYLIAQKIPTYLGYSLYEMMDTESVPDMNLDTITKYEQTWNGESISIEKNTEGSEYDPSDMMVWFMTTGFEHEIGCSTSELETLFGEVAELAYKTTVDKTTEVEKLEEYGLANPPGRITIEYTENTTDGEGTITAAESKSFTLLVGAETGSSYYVKTIDGDKVFTMAKNSLDTILTKTKYDYVYRYPAIVNVRTVNHVLFHDTDAEYELGVVTTTAADEDGNLSDTFTYSCNGAELESDLQSAASNLYTGIIGLYAEKIIDQPEELGTPLDFTMTFERKEGYKTIEIKFYEYNSSYVLAAVNGDAIYLINARDLDSYKTQIFASMDSFQ